MASYGISRAFMFCLDEPDRHPRSRAANDRTLAFAERSNGRLIPFVRLDLNESPIEEATRCLDAGARGIKLHPRAQRFTAGDERLAPGLRARRRAPRADPDPRRPRPAADRRRPARARRPLPGRDADHRARRHRRPRRARRLHGGPQGRALRHLDVEPGRPARLLPPGPAGAGGLRERLPVRAAAGVAPDRAQDRTRSPATTTTSCARCSAARRTRSPTGCELPEPTTPLGERAALAADAARAHPPVPLDGDAAPLDAPAGHRRRARASRSTRAPSATAHADAVDRIRELLVAARDLWATLPEIEDEADQRAATRLDVPPDPHRGHRGGDAAA